MAHLVFWMGPLFMILMTAIVDRGVRLALWFYMTRFTTFLVSGFVVGIFVQIINVTTVTNVLVERCHTDADPRGTLLRFKLDTFDTQWRELYKATVGALHVYSWRTTPATLSSIIVASAVIAFQIVSLTFGFRTVMAEPDISDNGRVAAYFSCFYGNMVKNTAYTSAFIATTVFAAVVSSRYRRLQVLIATLRTPDHDLMDLEILQQQVGALTVFDFPITFEVVKAGLQLLLIQVAVLALAVAGS